MNTSVIYAVIAVAVLLVGAYIVDLKNDIASLREELAESEKSLFVSRRSVADCLSIVDEQNKGIAIIKSDKKALMKELDVWLAKPPKIRYETIYKNIPTVEVESNECEDIKNMLDGIRTTSF